MTSAAEYRYIGSDPMVLAILRTVSSKPDYHSEDNKTWKGKFNRHLSDTISSAVLQLS